MVRLMEIVNHVVKHDMMFTNEELDQISEDAQAVFSKEMHSLIKALVRQARMAVT